MAPERKHASRRVSLLHGEAACRRSRRQFRQPKGDPVRAEPAWRGSFGRVCACEVSQENSALASRVLEQLKLSEARGRGSEVVLYASRLAHTPRSETRASRVPCLRWSWRRC